MKQPEWFILGEPLIRSVIPEAGGLTRAHKNIPVRVAAECAVIHFAHCLNASIEENRAGHHSVAVGLIRQCIEALTIAELGLIPSEKGMSLFEKWQNDKSHGYIRKQLEAQVWPSYGSGLWNEPWADFFGNLARAVQDYAHYSPALQGWQMIVEDGSRFQEGEDGMLYGLMRYGIDTYDPGKATRVTLLHILLCWTLGRIIVENKGARPGLKSVTEVGVALSQADILGHGKLEWAHQFWPIEFDGIEPYKGS